MEITKQQKSPVKFIQTLRGGTAHVLLFSDGNKYVVKWNGVAKKREKEVINEYVAAQLAKLLSLPVPPFELVYIPAEFIDNTPELHSKKYEFCPGCHYACLFIENSSELRKLKPLPSQTEIQNSEILARMLVFDQWINNTDRTMSNVLLERLSDGNFYVHMIDHGKCFLGGYNWSAKTLRKDLKHKTRYQETYQWAFSIIHEEHLTSFVEMIVSLPNESIYEAVQSIPKEWAVTKEESEALYQFLVKQKTHLPTIITYLISQYKGKSKK
ncbi:HipA family kinase [Anoxybacteroides tepidamans]|uniref:HipA family kinase n=1 Tax=Anoxybacteroides tepidamans TaxID=265948 RepID=UPI0018DE91E6|nr:HipA family kinase [Anoxybacillus tepidamans]